MYPISLFCSDIPAKFYIVYDLEEQPTEIECVLTKENLKTIVNGIKNGGPSKHDVYLRLFVPKKVDSPPWKRGKMTVKEVRKFIEKSSKTFSD